MNAPKTKLSILLLALAGTTAAILPNAIAGSAHADASGLIEASEPDQTQLHAMDMAFNISDAFQYAAEKIEPSVVHITVRNAQASNRLNEGLGSGVIVDPRGYILTNHHVIEAGRYITVRLHDGRELGARLVGSFPETDIAVIKVDAEDITPASFADSEAVRVGQWVLAIGSPFGFEQTVTAGIVSAKGRGSSNSPFGNGGNNGMQKLQEFIQTDAAINPGNSGGPLVDLHGNIVGINTAIISRTGSNNGLGFSIPSDIAQAVMEQIIETGRVERGWLGISMLPLAPVKAHQLKIKGGVVIQSISEDSPAEKAGLQEDDIIISLGGRTTENIVRLSNAIMLTKPNEPAQISFIRNGDLRTTTATVSDRDDEILVARGGVYLEEIGAKLTPSSLTKERNRRIVARLPGFVVSDIDRDSPADLFGLRIDDFVYQIDGRAFENAEEIEDYVQMHNQQDSIRIQFYRGRQAMYVDLDPSETP